MQVVVDRVFCGRSFSRLCCLRLWKLLVVVEAAVRAKSRMCIGERVFGVGVVESETNKVDC